MSLISCGRWKCHSFVKFESWRMKPTVWSASSRQAKLCTVRTAFRHWKGQRNTSEQCQLMQGVQSIPFSRRKSWRSRDLPLRTENAFTKVVTQHMGQRLRALHILIQRSMHSKTVLPYEKTVICLGSLLLNRELTTCVQTAPDTTHPVQLFQYCRTQELASLNDNWTLTAASSLLEQGSHSLLFRAESHKVSSHQTFNSAAELSGCTQHL